MNKINGISIFSGAGIDELLLYTTNIEIKYANELIKKRADIYSFLHPNVKMINGDISSEDCKRKIVEAAKFCNARFLLATPPCQGFSTLGKNKNQKKYISDARNFLIFHTMDIIDALNFDYILIENVPLFLKMLYPWKGKLVTIDKILLDKYSCAYKIDIAVLNAEYYGVPQSRPRSIIKIYKKHLSWPWPQKEKPIPLKESIGYLPSLEPGQASSIKWHYAKPENPRIVLAMRHTPSGCSALNNPIYYPKKEDGTRIKGFHNTFKRMKWDEPCPARTTYCGSMSSHNNVHPGRKLPDGTYSDPRVLTLLETFIVSSIPTNIEFPPNCSDTLIRTLVGEGIPPLMLSKIVMSIEQ